MTETQLFFTIHKSDPDREWMENISSALKGLPGISELFVIERNEKENTQINMNYDSEKCSLNEIESIVEEAGAAIIDINIHFPSEISGVFDVYGASAVSLPLQTNLNMIEGVVGSSISSNGIIKVELDPVSDNKNNIVKNILASISRLRGNNI